VASWQLMELALRELTPVVVVPESRS
jgi:hypothetical protein